MLKLEECHAERQAVKGLVKEAGKQVRSDVEVEANRGEHSGR